MRILLVYPNNTGYSRVPIGLALIYTCLLEAGHEVKIYDTTFYNIFKQTDDDIREKLCEDLGFIKNVDVIREGLGGKHMSQKRYRQFLLRFKCLFEHKLLL